MSKLVQLKKERKQEKEEDGLAPICLCRSAKKNRGNRNGYREEVKTVMCAHMRTRLPSFPFFPLGARTFSSHYRNLSFRPRREFSLFSRAFRFGQKTRELNERKKTHIRACLIRRWITE